MSAVVRAVLLNRIVGKVDGIIIKVVMSHRVLIAGQAQIALPVKVRLKRNLLKEIDFFIVVKEDPDSDVEFTAIDQSRLLDVLLNYKCSRFDASLSVTSIMMVLYVSFFTDHGLGLDNWHFVFTLL